MKAKTTFRQKIFLLLFSLFIFFVLLEIGLRAGGSIFLSLQEQQNRVSISKKDTYRIMCLGESTTVFGGKDSYPSQLETILNARKIGVKFSIINKGATGAKTPGIVNQLENNLNKYKPNMIITMMGINDVGNHLPYEAETHSKTIKFLRSFKTYKLTRLIQLHLQTKTKKIKPHKKNVRKKTNSLDSGITFIKKYNTCIKLGQFYVTQTKYKQAEAQFKKAIKLNSKDERAYSELGCIYAIQGKYTRAKIQFKKAITINPNNDFVHIKLGSVYHRQGKLSQAEEQYKKAIECAPESTTGYTKLGWFYAYVQKKYQQAEVQFKKAIEIDPSDEFVYARLGTVYINQQKYQQAEKMLKKAIEIKSNPLTLGALATIYSTMGKKTLADEYYKKINKLQLQVYNVMTKASYHKLKDILDETDIMLVCVQYPMRSLKTLINMFDDPRGITFVDNEKVFKAALRRGSYADYFADAFAGDFGHCTFRGNKLLAENIADIILEKYFNQN